MKCAYYCLQRLLKKASDIFKDLYGQEHTVTNSLVGGLLKGLRSVPEDSDALTKLSSKYVQLRSCAHKEIAQVS